MKFHTERLSTNMHRTPEGFLLCENVPIGRTGVLLYGPGETPIMVGADGIARVMRDEEVCFEAQSLESLSGKAVVNEHPFEDVVSTNWSHWSKGVVLNPRRGTGEQKDLLLADLLIHDAATADDVLAGKREVSAGYTCDYHQTGEGTGRQAQIRYNHVALVDSGRCGQRCSIQDSAYSGDGDTIMKPMWQRVADAIRSGDQRTIDRATCDAEEEITKAVQDKVRDQDIEERVKATEDSLTELKKTVDEGFAGINGRLGDLATAGATSKGGTLDKKGKGRDEEAEEEKTADRKGKGRDEEAEEEKTADRKGKGRDEETEEEKTTDEETEEDKVLDEAMEEEAGEETKDAAFWAPTFQDTVAMAEIIAPGIKLPTYDSSASPVTTYRSICALRRKALQSATNDSALAPVMAGIRGGRTIDSNELLKLPCNKVRDMFFAVGTAKSVMNTQSQSTTDSAYVPMSGGGLGVPGVMKTPADLNKRFAEIYK